MKNLEENLSSGKYLLIYFSEILKVLIIRIWILETYDNFK